MEKMLSPFSILLLEIEQVTTTQQKKKIIRMDIK